MTSIFLLLLALDRDPVALVADATVAEKAQETLRQPFVYRERQRNWKLNDAGQKEREAPWLDRIFEHIFLEGQPYKQLLESSGKPLSGADLVKREASRKQEAARRLVARREEKAGGKRFLPGTRNVRMGKIGELAEAYNLKFLGEELIDGRLADKILAEPNGQAETPRKKEFQSYRQTLWIDQATRVVAKRQVEVIGPDSETLPGTIITLYFAPVEGQDIWFEHRSTLDFGVQSFGILKQRGLQIHEFYGFRQFQVESTLTPIE